MVFSGSSRSQGRNSDGTWKIYCSTCGKFVSNSDIKLGKITCALCDLAEQGKALSPEQIDMYQRSKMGARDLTVSHVDVVDDPTLTGSRPFNLRGLGATISKAFGFEKPPQPELQSVQVAQGKRKKRLFEDVDLEQDLGLGSMEQIDGLLNPDKTK